MKENVQWTVEESNLLVCELLFPVPGGQKRRGPESGDVRLLGGKPRGVGVAAVHVVKEKVPEDAETDAVPDGN